MDREIESVEARFYQDVADLLGVENNNTYNELTVGRTYRTRWNNRKPGSGRFEGYGMIRFFGRTMIHVAITRPVHINKVFESPEEALAFLKNAIDNM